MAVSCDPRPPSPPTSLSFSILVSSPIRCNLPFIPVSVILLPLAKVNVSFAAQIITGINILVTFLFRRSLVSPPLQGRTAPDLFPVTLTLTELTNLIQAAANHQLPMSYTPTSLLPDQIRSNPLGQGQGPVGGDEPLFPDNLSISLSFAAPFAPFDGSPDTNFNCPLFEIPGTPGNLIITLCLLIAQFFQERSGVNIPACFKFQDHRHPCPPVYA